MAKVSMIPEDYDVLKIEYLSLKKQIDEVNQDLHNSRRQLKVIEALQNDYQNEIDMLQSEEIRQKQKYQETILNLEETINKMRIAHSEKILALETELMKMEEKYEGLEAEVDVLRKSNTDMSFGGDTSKLIEEILSLKEENNGFNENHEQLLTNLKGLQETNSELQRCLVESREEISNLQGSLDCKRDELAEANKLIQKLNDDVVCLKSELETFKSKPLDEKSKGNSLFAEVDDRRVYLQDTINKMKADYIAMKQERATNLNTIHQQKLEISRLMDRWRIETLEKEDEEYETVKSLQDRIKVLEDINASCRKDLDSKPVVLYKNNREEMQYYEVVLRNKNKEIKELQEQLSSRTVNRILLSSSLKKANEEKRLWHLEATKKQHQLELLEIEKKLEGSSTSESKSDKINDSSKETPSSACKENTIVGLERERSNVTFRRSGSESYRKSIQEKRASTLKEISEENRTKTDELPPIINDDEKVVSCASGTSFGKENCTKTSSEPAEKVKPRKKATFSESTVSPNKTSFRRCRKIIVSKPVFFQCDPK